MLRARSLLFLVPVACSACAAPPRPLSRAALTPQVRTDTVPVAFSPRTVGVMTLLSMELPPAGTSIGGHFAGLSFQRQVTGIQLGDGIRQRWSRTTRSSGDSALIAAGFRVHVPGPRSSDAEALPNVRFGLSGVVTRLQARSYGYVEPYHHFESAVRVRWELLDLATGSVVFEGTSSSGEIRTADSLEAAINVAVARAVTDLARQPDFQQAVMRPRPVMAADLLTASFARRFPAAEDTIVIAPGAQNMSPETGIVGGIVMLNGTHGYRSSAVVLTRDGLVLTQGSAGTQRWIYARHFDGRMRAARVLRANADVALVELSCEESCETVAWAPDTALSDRAPVIWVGARSGYPATATAVMYQWRALRVDAGAREEGRAQWSRWRVRGPRPPAYGESVAREDGTVVGIAIPGRVVPIAEALRSLGVSLPAQ